MLKRLVFGLLMSMALTSLYTRAFKLQELAPKNQFSVNREIDVQEQFKEYNEEYFGGKLPRDTKVTFEDIPKVNGVIVLGLSWCNSRGIGCWIQLNRNYQDASVIYLEVELHEMVHIELATRGITDTSHGRPFQAEMKRLAMENAFEDLW